MSSHLFSIVYGLATDVISVHVLTTQSFVVVTDEFADERANIILIGYIMKFASGVL